MVSILLEHEEIDVNLQSTDAKRSALSQAVFNGHNNIVTQLLTHTGADVHLRSETSDEFPKGESALAVARRQGNQEAIELIEGQMAEKISTVVENVN